MYVCFFFIYVSVFFFCLREEFFLFWIERKLTSLLLFQRLLFRVRVAAVAAAGVCDARGRAAAAAGVYDARVRTAAVAAARACSARLRDALKDNPADDGTRYVPNALDKGRRC